MYKILIVDDEKIERNGIKLLLKQLDHEFEVSEAGNGMIALDMIKENEYDILLTDIKMPFMDGMELIEKVLRKHGGNRKAAAAELGISERTLYRKINMIRK